MRGQVSLPLINAYAPGCILTIVTLPVAGPSSRPAQPRAALVNLPLAALPVDNAVGPLQEAVSRKRKRTSEDEGTHIYSYTCSIVSDADEILIYQNLSRPRQADRPHFLGSSPRVASQSHPPPGRSARRKSATWLQTL